MTRSEIMSRIRGRDTGPELAVKASLRGLRLRHQPKGIDGRPDFAHKGRKVAVFVDGCFWHGCPRCYRKPKSNVAFWRGKVRGNRARDRRNRRRLRRAGWSVVSVWEHEVGKGGLTPRRKGEIINLCKRR